MYLSPPRAEQRQPAARPPVKSPSARFLTPRCRLPAERVICLSPLGRTNINSSQTLAIAIWRCAVLSLVLGALFFAGIHLGIAGTAMRDRAIGILGENGYRGTFAVASVVGLGWLVAAYNRAPYLVTWGMLEWWKPIAIILMLPASLLVVIGLMTPNPTSVAQEGTLGQPPRGIVLGYASSVSDGGRPLGAAASYWQWRCRIPGLFRDLGDRSSGWHRIDRCKASAAFGCRLGAICGADLHCSVCSDRCGAKPGYPS